MTDSSGHNAGYRFGVFEVDTRKAELRKSGRQIRLRGRPFDILLLLLEAGGALVSRDELRQRLWSSETFVDFDHGLNTAVNRLREALGDSAESPRFIETIPRRGYRFIAPIAPISAAVVSAPAPQGATSPPASVPAVQEPAAVPRLDVESVHRDRVTRRLVIRALVLAALVAAAALAWRAYSAWNPSRAASKMTIAVLPFANLSGETAQEYLSDGFTEELIAELGRLQPQRIGVVARTTVMQYKNTRKSIGEIGRELGAEYVLEGSVRRAAGRMRITAQLVSAANQTNLWSETYERTEEDALTLQSEVAGRIAQALAVQILPAGGQPARQPTSFAAYEYVLRGRFFREQATEASARKAIEYFRKAIEIEPNYALAHAGLSDAYRLLAAPGWEVELPSTLLGIAKQEAAEAQRLGPELPESYAASAMVRLTYDWDLRGAEVDLQRALALNPSFAQAHQYYSGVLTTMQRPDDAIHEARRAFELDPLSRTASTTLGVRLYYAGRNDEAAVQFRRTLEVNANFGVAHWGLAQTLRMRGRFDDSVKSLRAAVDFSDNSSYMRAWLGHGLAVAGRRDEALAILRALESDARSGYVSPFHFALVYAGLRDDSSTIDWLEKAFADGSGWMPYLPVENEFAHLRSNPRFQRLLSRIHPPG